MPIPLIFRTTDLLKWGAGKGSNLTPGEVDENFWELWALLTDLTSEPLQPLEIQSIAVTGGDQMRITMSDGTTVFGPFTLPKGALTFRDAWEAGTLYHPFDLFTADDGLYVVLQEHTSASDFSPSDGNMAGPFAKLVMPFPSIFDIGFSVAGTPGSGVDTGQNMFTYRFARDAWLPVNCAGSRAGLASHHSDADISLDLYKNATLVGNLTLGFTSSDDTVAFTLASGVQFHAGDTLGVRRPTVLDTFAFGLSITFAARLGTLGA